MSNPLLSLLQLLHLHRDDDAHVHAPVAYVTMTATQASATIFLVLRRMRTPLIVLIIIFAVSVLGLSLIPGRDESGQSWSMTFFDAFYFMSYTATTIGFGEIPHTFTSAQRMWVTFSIYLTVIGWAYAIGSMLALLQDRSFRDALNMRRFTRRVTNLREPFLLMVGYGQTGRLLGRALDDRGRRLVVIDSSERRIDDLDLDSYHMDVPALVADARDPERLAVAGLGSPCCEGVVAITNDDEVNLAVTMTTALLRPELPIIARTSSRAIGRRMAEFGDPVVINPFDRFSDRLAMALRAPSAYQLLSWLTDTEDGGPPALLQAPPTGCWVVCGYGRFGREISADLRAQGFEVVVVEPAVEPAQIGPAESSDGSGRPGSEHQEDQPDDTGPKDAAQPDEVLAGAELSSAVGLVAATGNDTTNLSLVAAARRANPSLFLVARENVPSSSPLYEAMRLDALLVSPDMVAREALARLGDPLLWDFLSHVPDMDDAWAAALVERLGGACGAGSPHLWDVRVCASQTPALLRRSSGVRLGDVLRDPDDRQRRLDAVPLLLLRDGEASLCPSDDVVLTEGDELLLGGRPAAHHVLEGVLLSDGAVEYLVSGRRVPAGWVWRRVSEALSQRG